MLTRIERTKPMKKLRMDKAREKTDKQLKTMERNIGRVYRTYPALIAVEKEYKAYMSMVEKKTNKAYNEYIKEKDINLKEKLKKVYTEQLKALTIESKDYKKLVKKISRTLAATNQYALDIVNAEMISIYTENYNQVAEECERVGINVNGTE